MVGKWMETGMFVLNLVRYNMFVDVQLELVINRLSDNLTRLIHLGRVRANAAQSHRDVRARLAGFRRGKRRR